jgi:hypothetical protein
MHDERITGLRRSTRISRTAVVLLLMALVAGCGQDSKLGSVHGTVRLDGNPLKSGSVQFTPAAGRAATGTIQTDGTYTLGTYGSSDGALIGTHKVAIIAYDVSGPQRPAYEMINQKSKPLVPQRYMSVGTSGLTFDVKPGENQADFDLNSR